jgi:hypothetical protein
VGGKKTVTLRAGIGLGILLAIVLIVTFLAQHPVFISGAIVTYATDSARELPIADVEVTFIRGSWVPAVQVHSDAAGFFRIPIPLERRIRRDLPVALHFRHPNYQPLDLPAVAPDKLCIAHLTPLSSAAPAPGSGPEVKIANVVVKYSINTTTTLNVGSAVKVFQVVNTGNVPCKGRRPCSPDGAWKAAVGSAKIDAGPGNEFRNARTSCIAGPCPFTKIEDSDIHSARDSQTIRVSALDWSDTATFLLEAEVYKPVASDVLRQSYPVIFGRALTFTLPAAAEGVSIQAELNGATIVFPLGPSLLLSWANCQLQVNRDQTKVYRCELKAGYRFT